MNKTRSERAKLVRLGRPKKIDKTFADRTQTFLDVLQKHKFNPAEALIDCYTQARKIYDSYGTIFDAISEARENKGMFPIDDKAHQYLKIALDAAKELARYSFPALKAVEQKQPDRFDQISLEDKIRFLEGALEVYKARGVNVDDDGSTTAG